MDFSFGIQFWISSVKLVSTYILSRVHYLAYQPTHLAYESDLARHALTGHKNLAPLPHSDYKVG